MHIYRAIPRCAWCNGQFGPKNFCDTCCMRRCFSELCKEPQAHIQDAFHQAAACTANDPRLFEEQLHTLLQLGDKPDAVVLKTFIHAMLASMHLHDMRTEYAPSPDVKERTAQWEAWRKGAFPRASPEGIQAYMQTFPRLSSDFHALASMLFAALVLCQDGSMDAIVQLFIVLFYQYQMRLADLSNVKDGKCELVPTHRRFVLLTNPIINPVTKAHLPIVQISTCEPTADTLPSAFITELFARPAAKSLILFDLLALDKEESEYAIAKGKKPALLLSTAVLMFATKKPKGECAMRLVQAHRQFYNVGCWLNGVLPASAAPDLARVTRDPLSTGTLTERIDFDFVGKAMDTLVKRTSTPDARRDAYRDLTGVRVNDAVPMPLFSITYIEANQTV